MESVRKNIISIVSYNYGIGDGGYIEIHEMISDMKVEVDVGEDKYVTKGNVIIITIIVVIKIPINHLKLPFAPSLLIRNSPLSRS